MRGGRDVAEHKYIGLQGFVDAMGGAKGRRGDDILCTCPAHDDKKPSLYVREGDKGIICHCMVGCTNDQICAARGIDMASLFRDPPERRGSWSKKPAAKPAAPKPAPATDSKPAKACNSYAEAYGYLGKLVTTYQYTDSNDALVFEVARIATPDGGKTFRQHRPVKPDGGSTCNFPIRLDVPASMRDNIIFRQRETEEAVRRGETIYIVEGEKDVLTLARLGRAATTNAGGGGRGQWKDGHTAHLRGAAEIVILPDNDPTGEGHGSEVWQAVSKVAKRAYIVNLRDGWPECPPKGDFTDLAEAVGDQEALRILDELTEAARRDLRTLALKAYNSIPGYNIDRWRTVQIDAEGNPRQLCNFVALPVRELTVDDGVRVEMRMEIAGWRIGGASFPSITIPVSDFKSLDWALNNWGLGANIMPGNAVRDRLRYVIQAAGEQVARRETLYGHFGWRMIDGRWCYLHHDGCIGYDGIRAEYTDRLRNYGLGNQPAGMDEAEAAFASFRLTEAIAPACSVPLLGVTYLAPLTEFLTQAGCPPSFATMLISTHGSGKSTIAALFLSHYGRFNYQSLPSNFHNTGNAIRQQAFIAKDTVLCVDDYHPEQSIQARRQMQALVQTLARAFGDHADRARLDSNMKLQAAMPPRSLALMTGEQVPEIGQSGVARFYAIRIEKDTFPRSPDGAMLMRQARDGALRMAMTSYIKYLATIASELPAQLDDMFTDYKERAHDMIAGDATNDRADEAVAHIMIGLTMMTRWLVHLGLMDDAEAARQLGEWWPVVVSNSRQQGRESKAETPTNMFMEAVSNMLLSGMAQVDDLTAGPDRKQPKERIGYCDANNYYLFPVETYRRVVKFYNEQNIVYPINKDTLLRALRAEGIVEQWDVRQDVTTKQKFIDGKNQRVLWIPRWKLDGGKKPEPTGEQMKMGGFTEVEDAGNPFTE